MSEDILPLRYYSIFLIGKKMFWKRKSPEISKAFLHALGRFRNSFSYTGFFDLARTADVFLSLAKQGAITESLVKKAIFNLSIPMGDIRVFSAFRSIAPNGYAGAAPEYMEMIRPSCTEHAFETLEAIPEDAKEIIRSDCYHIADIGEVRNLPRIAPIVRTARYITIGIYPYSLGTELSFFLKNLFVEQSCVVVLIIHLPPDDFYTALEWAYFTANNISNVHIRLAPTDPIEAYDDAMRMILASDITIQTNPAITIQCDGPRQP